MDATTEREERRGYEKEGEGGRERGVGGGGVAGVVWQGTAAGHQGQEMLIAIGSSPGFFACTDAPPFFRTNTKRESLGLQKIIRPHRHATLLLWGANCLAGKKRSLDIFFLETITTRGSILRKPCLHIAEVPIQVLLPEPRHADLARRHAAAPRARACKRGWRGIIDSEGEKKRASGVAVRRGGMYGMQQD